MQIYNRFDKITNENLKIHRFILNLQEVMADNYIGNRMDDYLAGRLKTAVPRRRTPSGRRPGTLELGVDPGAMVWIPEGALLPAGRKLIELLANSGLRVSYRAESGKAGAEPAVKFGARHYPPSAPAPEGQMSVCLSDSAITIDSDRISISYSPESADSAAAVAASFLTEAGRRVSRADIII